MLSSHCWGFIYEHSCLCLDSEDEGKKKKKHKKKKKKRDESSDGKESLDQSKDSIATPTPTQGLVAYDSQGKVTNCRDYPVFALGAQIPLPLIFDFSFIF